MSSATSKPIRLTAHARGYFVRRGFSEADVEATIRGAPWQPARQGRLQATKDFPLNQIWNSRWYATRQVRAVFVDEPGEIVVITVYTYFF